MSKEITSPTAFVTLVTTESYVIGAQVLAKSLLSSGTQHRLICMVTPNLPQASIRALGSVFNEVRLVDPLDSKDAAALALLGRPELGCTFTKIQLWRQTDLSKVVFLDADMLVLQNIDSLFQQDEFSAVPDVGWPDCFNSGLFVCRPDEQTYRGLLQMAQSIGSFDGGDQGLLNQYFSAWCRLPFGYNLTFSASYSYAPAFKHFRGTVKTVHFIGTNKPWTFHRFSDGRVCPRGDLTGDHLDFVQQWWATHDLLATSPAALVQCERPLSPHAPRHDYHVTWHSARAPPCAPACYGKDEPGFANYKISWCPDIESHFGKMDVSPANNREPGHHKVAYKAGFRGLEPSTPSISD